MGYYKTTTLWSFIDRNDLATPSRFVYGDDDDEALAEACAITIPELAILDDQTFKAYEESNIPITELDTRGRRWAWPTDVLDSIILSPIGERQIPWSSEPGVDDAHLFAHHHPQLQHVVPIGLCNVRISAVDFTFLRANRRINECGLFIYRNDEMDSYASHVGADYTLFHQWCAQVANDGWQSELVQTALNESV